MKILISDAFDPSLPERLAGGTMKILISDAFDPSLPERLAKFGEVTDDKDQLADCEVVLIRSKTKCTREYIDSAPKLKVIIRGGVGLDNVDLDYAQEKGIFVSNTASASAVAVAELAFAHMVSIPARLVEGHMSMLEGQWIKKELKRTELFGKTLGLIGVGNIGTEVAKRAQAFGMKVLAYDKYLDSHDIVELVELDELAAQSDYISLHTPLTDETRGMIDADLIGKMKDGVILINTGRGKVIDDEAVVAALASGKMRAYGTDVWESDPPPADSPLLKAKNIFMTPHLGASSKENLLRIGDVVISILEDRYGN
jgi:D-3-phosphoglycerate dehydrogenase